MSNEPPANAGDEALLADLFDDLLQRILEGESPDLATCLPDRPDLRDRIAQTWTLACSVAGRREPGRPVLGGYEILRELGHGGMGTVYLARHETLQREVAIKVLPHSLALSPRSKQRFLEEAMALARIRHENVVRIHRILDHGEMLAFEMEFVDGQSLLQLVRELRATGSPPSIEVLAERIGVAPRTLGTRSTVEWFVRVCAKVARALHEVHVHGLVHRDVKPSNILLRSDGSPVLADFGLAQIADFEASRSGAFAGTPTYAAPERLRGGDIDVDARTDVYSLGVTLYELLTLEAPYSGSSTLDVLQRIEAGRLPALRQKAPHVSRDLATIVHKAMEPDPHHRYATAGEFADDLDRLLHLQPILARPVGSLRRCAKFVRRHQRVVVAGAIGALLAVAAAWPVTAHARARELARREAEGLLQQARSTLLTPESLYVAWKRSFSDAGEQPLQHPTARAEHEAALLHAVEAYDRVLAVDPERADASAERAAVTAALVHQQRRADPAAVPQGSWTPLFTEVTRNAVDARDERSEAAPMFGDAAARDRFAAGLYAFLLGDQVTCRAAWHGLEQELPEQPLLSACLALLLADEGRAEWGLPRLFQATRSFPDATVLALSMANAALVTRDAALAEHWLERVPDDPADHITSARRRLLAGDLYVATGRADEAAAIYRGLATDDVTDPVPLQRLAVVELARGEVARARRILDVVVERWPDAALARRQLAELHLEQHDLAAFLQHVRFVLAQDLDRLPRAAANDLAQVLVLGGFEPLRPSKLFAERGRGDVRSVGSRLQLWVDAARLRGIREGAALLSTWDRAFDRAARVDSRPIGVALRAAWFTAMSVPQVTAALPPAIGAVVLGAPPLLLGTPTTLATNMTMPFSRILGDRAVTLSPDIVVPLHWSPRDVMFACNASGGFDLDGDTLADFCIASRSATVDSAPGRVDVRSAADGGLLHVLQGRADARMFAAAIDVIPDIDGDRCADLLVGSNSTDAAACHGLVEARSGRTGAVIWSVEGRNQGFGSALAVIRDVDGDGVHDFVVGSPSSPGLRGRAFVVSGATGTELRELHRESANPSFGAQVVAVGDVNADGVDDVLVSTLESAGGHVTLFSCSDGSRLAALAEEGQRSDFGYRAAGLGDIDGDGHADFAISAPGFSDREHQQGRVSVVSGKSGKLIYRLRGERVGDAFGMALCALPHWRRDGRTALAVSAYRGSPTGAGYVRVFDARTGQPLQTVAPNPAVTLFGPSLVDLGDRDGDGLRDLGVPLVLHSGDCGMWSVSYALVSRR